MGQCGESDSRATERLGSSAFCFSDDVADQRRRVTENRPRFFGRLSKEIAKRLLSMTSNAPIGGLVMAWAVASQLLVATPFPTQAGRSVAETLDPHAVWLAEELSEMQELTTILISMLDDYSDALNSDDRSRILLDMQQVALARQGILEGLMHYRPQRVVKAALKPDQRERFPVTLRDALEELITVEGVVQVLQEDDELTGLRQTEYHLLSGLENYRLHFIGEAPELPTGSPLRVQGLRSGRHLVVLKD